MTKTDRRASIGKFALTRKSPNRAATITNKETGKTLSLKGYGAMKGEFQIREGVDLTKPIAAQASKKLSKSTKSTKSVAGSVLSQTIKKK